jgi:hypothetical protein
LISLPPLGPKNKDEGEEDKILSRVLNQLLTGKNDVIVAMYDANMEIDIAAVITMRRTIVSCISFAIHLLIQTLLLISTTIDCNNGYLLTYRQM